MPRDIKFLKVDKNRQNPTGGGFNRLSHIYENIISLENLLEAWKEFLNGKRGRKDVQEFQLNLMDNILSLHNDLKTRTYRHGSYHAFNISDPKPRNIHRPSAEVDEDDSGLDGPWGLGSIRK